jgi:hypothetical protein
MVVSSLWVILAWIMAVLLLANSVTILINIFDFPATGIRHLISFVAAGGVIAGLMFILIGISRYLFFLKRR